MHEDPEGRRQHHSAEYMHRESTTIVVVVLPKMDSMSFFSCSTNPRQAEDVHPT